MSIGSGAINPTVGRLLGITGYRKLGSNNMSSTQSRFLLYVKAGDDGKSLGDCPFSQRANMFCRMKVSDSDIELSTVNLYNKPEFFLKLNPAGTAPVLVDRDNNGKVIADSAEITKYLSEQIPVPDLQQSYSGPALEAVSGIFKTFVAMLTNTDESKDESLKAALVSELKKMDDYLKSSEKTGKFLVSDHLCEIDCQILPKLKHVQVAGKHFKGFEIPADLIALQAYIVNGEQEEIFKKTCAPDAEFICGWNHHFSK